jgi:4'-phosphopantetheinyl transferase
VSGPDCDSGRGPRFETWPLPLHDLPAPGAGEAHLWFIDLVELGNPLDPTHAIDREALTARQQRTLRHFYRRLLLGAYLGLPGKDVTLVRERRGKPHLHAAHASDLEFSTASSRGCCLIGVTRGGRIGVDLEPADRRARRPLALARRYFSAAEQQALQELPQERLDEGFLRAWASKEAVVKALGQGIANQLRHFTVSVGPACAPAVLAMEGDDPESWALELFRPADGYLGAVSVQGPRPAAGRLELKGFRLRAPG